MRACSSAPAFCLLKGAPAHHERMLHCFSLVFQQRAFIEPEPTRHHSSSGLQRASHLRALSWPARARLQPLGLNSVAQHLRLVGVSISDWLQPCTRTRGGGERSL